MTDQTALVLTNQHVVDEAADISVDVKGGNQFSAAIRGSDETRDLALLEMCCSLDFSKIAFGDSTQLQPGTDVIAVGYPVEGDATITRGIVSAFRFDEAKQRWEIQHDAAINPGNSGGPLITLNGDLVGLNTRKMFGPLVEGLGFAIREDTISELLPRLQAGEVVGTATSTPTPTPTTFAGFGPAYGELKIEEGGILQAQSLIFSGLNAQAQVRVTFQNPYSVDSSGRNRSSRGIFDYFDYGIMFKQTNGETATFILRAFPKNESRLYQAAWYTYLNGIRTGTGEAASMNRNADATNNLSFDLRPDSGTVTLNAEFLPTKFRVSGVVDIYLVAGSFSVGSVTGDRTPFSNFYIQPIPDES